MVKFNANASQSRGRVPAIAFLATCGATSRPFLTLKAAVIAMALKHSFWRARIVLAGVA